MTAAPGSHDPEAVEELMLDIGGVLLAAGGSVTDIQHQLRLIARVYGFDAAQVSVMPTVIHVSAPSAGRVRLGKPPRMADTRLDQAAAVFTLVGDLVGGDVPPDEAQRRLTAIRARPRRFGRVPMVGAHALLAVGLALILQPSWEGVGFGVVFGLLVGMLKVASHGARVGLGFLLPVLAAALVSALSFLILGQDSATQPIGALIAPSSPSCRAAC